MKKVKSISQSGQLFSQSASITFLLTKPQQQTILRNEEMSWSLVFEDQTLPSASQTNKYTKVENYMFVGNKRVFFCVC